MLQTTTTQNTSPRHKRRAPATAVDERLRNIRAFEANLGALKAAFPGLRHERTGTQIEWFLRAGRPLSATGLGLKGSLSIDIPCSEDTAEILDAMAYANDPTLDRARLAREIAAENAELASRLDQAVDYLHRLARRDLEAAGLRKDAYLRALSTEVGTKSLNLYPAWSQDEGTNYRPGQHVRDRMKAACAAALGAARASTGRARTKAEPPRRGQRPFRMRRYSALYD